jgi:serine/threonine-protein kinase HipA
MAWQGSKSRTSKPLQVQRRHLISTANRMGLGVEADTLVSELVNRTPGVITSVQAELPPGFPEQLTATILGGLQSSADQLQRQQTD